ncbi:MAG: hypothetical protein H5T83_06120 [Actinotalea sp.]|nr:hypothetical protein [Actinotalea sp.]
MAVLETTDGAPAPVEDAPAPGAGTGIRIAAVSLWGVVGSLLAYGVLQTVLKASALFG